MLLFRFQSLAIAGLLFLSFNSTLALSLQEDFSSSPDSRGWAVFGEDSVFAWNESSQQLEVAWDSSKTNSYFYHSLDTVLTKADTFSLAFDLRLNDVSLGGFELAIGFFNLADATKEGFLRGTGSDSPNLVEFDYFPEWTSMNATVCDSTSVMSFRYDARLPLKPGETYRIVLQHQAGEDLASASVYTNGNLYTDLPEFYASQGFGDFALNAIAIMNYSDRNAFGQLLARGMVDNLVVETTSAPVTSLTAELSGASWQFRCASVSGWNYALQRTEDFNNWQTVSGPVPGTGENLLLADSQPPAPHAFYRLKISR